MCEVEDSGGCSLRAAPELSRTHPGTAHETCDINTSPAPPLTGSQFPQQTHKNRFCLQIQCSEDTSHRTTREAWRHLPTSRLVDLSVSPGRSSTHSQHPDDQQTRLLALALLSALITHCPSARCRQSQGREKSSISQRCRRYHKACRINGRLSWRKSMEQSSAS